MREPYLVLRRHDIHPNQVSADDYNPKGLLPNHRTFCLENGLISPLDGINPEDIGINNLIDRVNEEKFDEIIFAFKPSVEG